MPYNTTAIPPRREATGQPALPLARVKKIIALDPDIAICSNNAAFVITLATEMFIQYLASEGHNMAKLDRKPRRNVQYKDLANAVAHQDNLQFLEDVIPKTVTYKKIRGRAEDLRWKLAGEPDLEEWEKHVATQQQDKRAKKEKAKQKKLGNGVNGSAAAREESRSEDPNAQLEMEMRQAAGDQDVDMTG